MLKPNETALIGQWKTVAGAVIADDACKRIESLIERHLAKVTTSPDGWSSLYQDPNDQRLWEHTYPKSHLHGGGPSSLTCISVTDAKAKYGSWPNPSFKGDALKRAP